MTDTSFSDVGRATVDTYLDSVEQALIVAHAPRSDRMQVLQDLESQISDMLAQQPAPLTEEMVTSVIGRLEPPSHFARTYGNGKEVAPSASDRFAQLRRARMPHIRWPLVSAVSCAHLPLGFLLAFTTVNMGRNPGVVKPLFFDMVLVGMVATPFTLWKALKQLRAQPSESHGRDLVLKSTIVYGVIAPALVMAVATAATHGVILMPLGVVAFVYLQYVLIRRIYRHITEATPQSPTASNESAAGSPVGATMPMTAL